MAHAHFVEQEIFEAGEIHYRPIVFQIISAAQIALCFIILAGATKVLLSGVASVVSLK